MMFGRYARVVGNVDGAGTAVGASDTLDGAANSGDVVVGRWKRELYWIVPLAMCVVGVTIALLANLRWGADVAAVLALPIGVLSMLFPMLLERGFFDWLPKGPGLGSIQSNRFKRAVSAAMVALLAGGLALYAFNREPDPFEFMQGTIKVGYYANERYPGWNVGENNERRGFDVELVRALQDYFDYSFEVQWVPLDSLDDRVAALTGEWGHGESVQLVVSNFSMTRKRRASIDFAGPYFVDSVGFLSHYPATRLADIPPGKVCVPAGATANETLTTLGWDPTSDVLERCLQKFKDSRDETLAVSTDLAILQAVARDRDVSEVAPIEIGREAYGIGLPNNRPRLCAELNRAIETFLDRGWDRAFDENLGSLGLRKNSRKPDRVDQCQPPVSWWPFGTG
jgi:glutamate transport system substrate-binding protein